jgi:hypothetical protein
MEYVLYLLFVVVGMLMGMLGGGGSILIVPLLVYGFELDPVIATGYSLFVVGITSLGGVMNSLRRGEINFSAWAWFGLPSVVSVYFTRRFLVPAIPDVLFSLGSFEMSRRSLLLTLFALLMIGASLHMLRKSESGSMSDRGSAAVLVLSGLLTGFITSLVGAGGGFIIVPALLLLFPMNMQSTVTTALMIIATNSFVGFAGDISHTSMNWQLLVPLAALSLLGVWLGQAWARRIPDIGLKKAFGWFVLAMGILILYQELISA